MPIVEIVSIAQQVNVCADRYRLSATFVCHAHSPLIAATSMTSVSVFPHKAIAVPKIALKMIAVPMATAALRSDSDKRCVCTKPANAPISAALLTPSVGRVNPVKAVFANPNPSIPKPISANPVAKMQIAATMAHVCLSPIKIADAHNPVLPIIFVPQVLSVRLFLVNGSVLPINLSALAAPIPTAYKVNLAAMACCADPLHVNTSALVAIMHPVTPDILAFKPQTAVTASCPAEEPTKAISLKVRRVVLAPPVELVLWAHNAIPSKAAVRSVSNPARATMIVHPQAENATNSETKISASAKLIPNV